MNILSMQEIEQRYAPGIGRHWFDADTMRFFRTRLAQVGYESADGKVYFVTSDQNRGFGGTYPRLYSVRVLKGPGDIDTVGEFQAFRTGKTADRYARGYASGNIPLPEVVHA